MSELAQRVTTRRRHIRVSELDRLFAGDPMYLMLSHTEMRTDSEIEAILDRIADHGPASRVGVIPSSRNRRWDVVTSPGKAVVQQHPDCCTDTHKLTNCVTCVTSRRPESPIEVWRCGRFVCIYCDHGLGDARFLQKVAAVITNRRLSPDVLEVDVTNTENPLGRALLNALMTDPLGVLRDSMMIGRSAGASMLAWRQGKHGGSSTAELIHAGDQDDSFSAYFASGSGVAELRSVRDRWHPGVSTTTLAMHMLCSSFLDSGADLASGVEVVVDLRRYLPKGVTTQGNFNAIVRLPFDASTTPMQFSNALRSELTSHRPLLALACSLARSKFRTVLDKIRWHPVRSTRQNCAPTRNVQLTISDFTRFVEGADVGWTHRGGSEMVTMTRPASEQHVCLVMSMSGDQRLQISACYHESHISRRMVAEAVDRALVCRNAARPARAFN